MNIWDKLMLRCFKRPLYQESNERGSKLSARTKAGLLGAHISHAGRFTEDGDMGEGAYISLIAAACAAILLGLLAAWVWGTFQ